MKYNYCKHTPKYHLNRVWAPHNDGRVFMPSKEEVDNIKQEYVVVSFKKGTGKWKGDFITTKKELITKERWFNDELECYKPLTSILEPLEYKRGCIHEI